jgi:chitodextrinase
MKKYRLIFGALIALTVVASSCSIDPPGPVLNQNPLAIFVPSVSTGPAPLAVSFDASGASDPDGTVVSYSWDFGDFTTGSGVTATHTFANAGTYTVTLTVTDNSGNSGESTTVITALGGPPPAPTGLTKTGSGCCDTYGDFAWNAVPGATSYEITMGSYFGGGCLTDASATFAGTATTGRVQAFGLCLGSHYNTKIRAQANGQWGPWSPTQNFTL